MPILKEAITGGVTTGHNADHLELHDFFNGLGDTFNITHRDYGASTSGTAAANTTAINAAFTAASAAATAGQPSVLVIPAGQDFPVTNNGVIGASNVIVTGGGTLSTTVAATVGAPGHLISFPAASTGWGVVGVRFKGPDNSTVAIKATSSKDFLVEDCWATNCTLIRTNADIATYATVTTNETTGNVCRGFRIANNTVLNTVASATNLAAVLILYVFDGVVTGNRIKNHHQGIQWWGGNAGIIPGEGELANERKCGRLAITGNVVTGSLEGGIWGSMGEYITVSGNTVDGAGDLGIDTEGGKATTITGNTVSGCQNGAIATFHLCSDITITGNTCTTSVLNGRVLRIQNGTGTAVIKGIRITGNVFVGLNVSGYVHLETAGTVEFSENTCRNVTLTSQTNNQKFTVIDGNSFILDVAISVAFNCVNVGFNNAGGRLWVRNNTILSTVAQPAGSRGIFNDQFDSSNAPIVVIEGNTVNGGFPISIETKWAGATAAADFVLIRNNMIPVGKPIVINNTGAALASVVVKTGNRYEDLTSAD